MNWLIKTISLVLIKIRPKLDFQFSLAHKMEIVDAVQEIAMMDNVGGTSANDWMFDEYKEILRDQELIRCARHFILSLLHKLFD